MSVLEIACYPSQSHCCGEVAGKGNNKIPLFHLANRSVSRFICKITPGVTLLVRSGHKSFVGWPPASVRNVNAIIQGRSAFEKCLVHPRNRRSVIRRQRELVLSDQNINDHPEVVLQ